MTHSCLFSCNMYVQPIFILVNVSNKQITTSEKYTSSKERSRCQRRRKLYYRAVALLKDEMSGEHHEEIPRSSDALFANNPKAFELPLFSSTSSEDLVRKARSWDGQSHITSLYLFPKCSSIPISTSCCLEVAVVALFLLPSQEKSQKQT